MTERSDVNEVIDDVLITLARKTPAEVDTAAVGDKVWSHLDPLKRSPNLAAFCGRMHCRLMARDRCRELDKEAHRREAARQEEADRRLADFMNPLLFGLELQDMCPTGNGTTWVRRLEMNLTERAAFSQALGHEIETKAEHKRAFDAETLDLIARDYFDDKGWPKGSERRVYAEQMALIQGEAE